MSKQNSSELAKRLWELGSAFRWTAREIEEGRITPEAMEAINCKGDPVCAFGWAMHKAGARDQATDNSELIVNFLNDEMSVLPKDMISRLEEVSDRVASVNDPITEDGEPINKTNRHKIAQALRAVGKVLDNLLKVAYKHDLAERKKKREAEAKEREKKRGRELLLALTAKQRIKEDGKHFSDGRKELEAAKEPALVEVGVEKP